MTLTRHAGNPILKPTDVLPSRDDLVVECLLNPGAFRYNGRTGLLLRVAEGPIKKEGYLSTPILDSASEGGVRVMDVRLDDPELKYTESRVFDYKGHSYLTTLSHLRLAWSDDGIHFTPENQPTLIGEGPLESFGVEDCRVEFIDGCYWLTYTAVSECGVCVGLISTHDWKTFARHGAILPPHNKDVALFPEKIDGRYYLLHRPSGVGLGGNYIWISHSPDMLHWGGHKCIAMTRADQWDSQRVGAGAAPIRTEKGWLVIYHGADQNSRYCLGAMLLDLKNPERVLARGKNPIMEPTAVYEKEGFFGNVVFSNGQVIDGDRITIYYGAADSVICMATDSIQRILGELQ